MHSHSEVSDSNTHSINNYLLEQKYKHIKTQNMLRKIFPNIRAMTRNLFSYIHNDFPVNSLLLISISRNVNAK